MPFYADSSALLKLAVHEEYTDAMRSWTLALGSPLATSDLGVSECIRAARRMDSTVVSAVSDVLSRCDVVALPRRLFATAAGLGDPLLRTLDALHLGVALELGDDLAGVVTYDRRMFDAARGLGITAIAPGSRGEA